MECRARETERRSTEMSAAPSLEELLSGVQKKAAEAPGGGPGRLGEPPSNADEEENVRRARPVPRGSV